MGILGIGIDSAVVFHAFVEEVEADGTLMTILVTLSTDEPIGGSLCLACYSDVVGRLCLQIFGIVPVYCHVADELEGIVKLLIIFRQVSSHLQWTVHGHIESQLPHKSRMDEVGIVAPGVQLCLKYTRCVIHRTTLQTGKRNDDGMVGSASAERLIFRSPRTLIAHHVGIGTAESGRSYRLMCIDHDMVLGSLLDAIEVVVVHRLREMVVATRDDITHIPALHCIVAIMVHQAVGLFHVALIVLSRRRGLVVHEEFYSLAVSIVVEHLDVKIGIGCDKVEHVAFPHVCPVLPTNVPTLDEHLVKAILCGEVDIAFHLLIIGGMPAVGRHLLPVNLVEFDGGQVVGVVPTALTNNHLPPHAAVFHGMNPRGILNLTGFVEVEDEVGGEHIAGIVAHHDGAPWTLARCLHGTFQSCSIWREMTDKGEGCGQRIG